MNRHLLYLCLALTVSLLAGCSLSPMSSSPELDSSLSNDETSATTDSSINTDNSDTSDDSQEDTTTYPLDTSFRHPLTYSDEAVGDYHDGIDSIDLDATGLTPSDILNNEGLFDLLDYLSVYPFNYTPGQIGVVDDPDSIYVLVNKLNRLSEDYVPDDLVVPDVPFYFEEFAEKKQMKSVAADALKDLFDAASEDGYSFLGASGYRSYTRQETIYNNNVKTRGQEETDKVSSRPGHSEHQTGLAIDLTLDSLNDSLDESLGDMDEGKWLEEHAHEYGFIVRYQKDTSNYTGYSYEPWHIRYIGVDVATFLYDHDLTVEELYAYIDSLIDS